MRFHLPPGAVHASQQSRKTTASPGQRGGSADPNSSIEETAPLGSAVLSEYEAYTPTSYFPISKRRRPGDFAMSLPMRVSTPLGGGTGLC